MTGPGDRETETSPPSQPAPNAPAEASPSPAADPIAEPAPIAPVEPPKRPRRRLLSLVAVVAAAIGVLGGKFIIGLLAVSVAGGAISAFFGGPWDKLPSDVRSAYTTRLQAAVGNRLDGLNDNAKSVLIEQWVRGGLLRLDDIRLMHRLDLEVEALGRTDEATCAAFGRQSLSGVQVGHEVGTKFVGSLEQPSLVDWIGINVDAIEAEIRGTPGTKLVADSAVTPVIQKMASGLAPAQLAVFGKVNTGAKVSDAEVCGAIRAFYQAESILDPQARAAVARFDVQPSTPGSPSPSPTP